LEKKVRDLYPQEGKNKIRVSEGPVYMVAYCTGSSYRTLIAEAIAGGRGYVRHVQSHYLRKGEITINISGKGGRLRENMAVKEEQFLAPSFHMAESGEILVTRDIKISYEKRVGHQVPQPTRN
jgi:hypothetical protein